VRFFIKRYCPNNQNNQNEPIEYEVDKEDSTLLEALERVKNYIDPTLTFSSGCRSEVCGSCTVRVNGKERLACGYKLKDGDIVEPLRYHEVLKDLVVDVAKSRETLKLSRAFLEVNRSVKQCREDEKRVELQSDCILCNSCFSSCPVYEVNEKFLGPFALTRVLRYIEDKRCEEPKRKIEAIQANGIWDCTLCGECSAVCPQHIDPKGDILALRNKSAAMGFMDPNFMQNMSFGGDLGF
jgi:fumarate reductase iron-sulfur subunit